MYAALPDPYCYRGTAVLRNRKGLRNQSQLDDFEADAILQRSDELFPSGAFDPSRFRAVHHHLFQDVYSCPGKYRTGRTSKGSSVFCYPENIEREVDRAFDGMHAQGPFSGRLPSDRFAEIGAEFLSELNAIHPFREGNGRTQMAFFAMLADHAGFPLNLEELEPAPFLAAMIDSFRGRRDALAVQLRALML